MDVPVRNVLKRVFSATCTQVSIGVPVALQVPVDRAHQGKTPNVELTVLVEEGLLDILLYDVTSLNTVYGSILYQALDVIKVFAHLDSTAPVCVLSWLDDPQLFAKLGQLVKHR